MPRATCTGSLNPSREAGWSDADDNKVGSGQVRQLEAKGKAKGKDQVDDAVKPEGEDTDQALSAVAQDPRAGKAEKLDKAPKPVKSARQVDVDPERTNLAREKAAAQATAAAIAAMQYRKALARTCGYA